jgi:nucleoid DNA-binding protein
MTDEAEAGETIAVAKAPTVTRKELALRVQKETNAKLKDVQLIIGATLKVMNDALKGGEQLRLPPFGAARVMRVADPATGTLMRVALREIKEKAPKEDRPARPVREPKAAPAARRKAAGKAGGKRGGAAKQALAAKNEAD